MLTRSSQSKSSTTSTSWFTSWFTSEASARPLYRSSLAVVTALPLLASLLAACNPGAVPAGVVAGAKPSASPSAGPTVRPSAKPTVVTVGGGQTSGSSQGSQSLGSASPAAGASASIGSSADPGTGSNSGSSSSSSGSPSPAASEAPSEEVYDTAIHLSEPVEARYVYRQRSDFSSLYPSYGYGYGYGDSYGGYPYSVPGGYYPSLFSKIESNTVLKLRFEPKPSRTLLVDIWVESQSYGGLNASPSPSAYPSAYPSAMATSDLSLVELSSFRLAQASSAPTSDPTSAPTAQPSASPSYREHYQVLMRLNGEFKEFLEPASLVGSSYYSSYYQKQISTYLRPFFSSYSPETVRLGNSWPARDNLFTNFDTLAGSSGQVRTTRSPAWSMESGGATVELSYRSEVRVTAKNGETETVKTFKESAKSLIDPGTGLLKKMSSTLSIDGDDKTPYLLELERL